MNKLNKATLSLLTSSLIFASFAVYIRYMSNSFSDISQSSARTFLTLIMISIYIIYKKKDITLSTKQFFLCISMGITFGLEMLFYTIAINQSTFSQSIITLYASILVFNTISSLVIFKEKLSTKIYFCVLLTIVGLLVLLTDNQIDIIAFIFAALAGFFDTVTGSLRKSSKNIDTNVVLFHQFVGTLTTVTLLLCFSNQTPYKGFNLLALISLIIFSISHFFLGRLLNYGFQNSTMANAGLLLVLEIPWVLILGFFLFDEKLNIKIIVSIILILAATVISQTSFKKTDKPITS